jgi:hypothetical protein
MLSYNKRRMKKVEAFSQECYKIDNETCVIDCANEKNQIINYKIPEATIVGAIGMENKIVQDYELFVDSNSDEGSYDSNITIQTSNGIELYSIRHNPHTYCCATIVTGSIMIFVVYLYGYFGKYHDDDSLRG